MSARYLHRCPLCGFEIEVWDDGYPFILDDDGKRHFFYHPLEQNVIDAVVAKSKWAKGKTPTEIRQDLPNHMGCLIDAICLDCGATFRRNMSLKPRPCTKCKSRAIQPVMDLGGNRCPKCKQGCFPNEPKFTAIS